MKNKKTVIKRGKKLNIYFTWTELPSYGYFLLKFIKSQLDKKKYSINFKVISTNTTLKKNYKDNSKFFRDIKWINPDKIYNWHDLNLENPHIYFQSGWNNKTFKNFAKITKLKNKNSKIILCIDNSLVKKSIRQFISILNIKFFLRKKFDYVLVPGFSARQLMLNCGFHKKQIFTGLYSSLVDIYKKYKFFQKGKKKQFIFVGRLVKVKNLERLIDAFNSITVNKEEWKLIIVGNGDLKFKKSQLGNNIMLIKGLPPSKLSILYRKSKFFILASHKDHWPLVVHEAALSGCFLLLSNGVGNIHEFANKTNSIIFDPKSVNSIRNSFEKAMLLTNKELYVADKESKKLGSIFNYKYSYIKFIKIINLCLNKKNNKSNKNNQYY